MRYAGILIFFLMSVLAQEAAFSGFITKSIWYSPDHFFADEVVHIWAGLFNEFDQKLEGRVEFFDGEIPLGKADFILDKGGQAGAVRVDWIAKEGPHTIRAKLSQTYLIGPDGKTAIKIPNAYAELAIEYVDRDTDSDKLGNRNDLDDDNDTLTDTEEQKLGFNPLKSDSDGDGVADNVERAATVSREEKGIVSKVTEILKEQKTALEKNRPGNKDREVLANFLDKTRKQLTKDGSGNTRVLRELPEVGRATLSTIGKAGLALTIFFLENKIWGIIILMVLVLFLARRWKKKRRQR